MQNKTKLKSRAKKIADLVALINGELAPDTVRNKKQLIAIDWGEEFGQEDWSVFLVDGKKVNRDKFYNELKWRQENKK
jgi:hypothetical protein